MQSTSKTASHTALPAKLPTSYAWTGEQPSAKAWRMFGSPVIVRLPGERSAKLDTHTAHGTFLGFTATDHNVYYRDSKTKRIKRTMFFFIGRITIYKVQK